MSDQNLWQGSQEGAEDFDASDIGGTQQIMSAGALDVGTSMVLTIRNGQPHEFNGKGFVLLEFQEVPELLRMTDNNLRRLVRLYGTSSASWRGQQVRLTVREITSGDLAGKHMLVLDSPDHKLGETLGYEPSQAMRNLLASQHTNGSTPEAARGKRK